MSGSAGGNRILREQVKTTVQDYQIKVLSKYPNYDGVSLVSGSYNSPEKSDFGDIDLIVQFKGSDKQSLKKDFGNFLNSLSEDIIVPFKSIKYKGKRFLNTGEIITILYPIKGTSKFVQIDNIFSISKNETNFKFQFLNLPANKQGLMLGLIKTIGIEHPEKLNEFPIERALKHNQEYEFNLSSSGLTLRLVTLDPNYKTISSNDIWKTTDWSIVENLLSEFDFTKSFEDLIKQIKRNIKSERSINRIKGIFKSMISIKSGEVDTPKGDDKQYSLDIVSQL